VVSGLPADLRAAVLVVLVVLHVPRSSESARIGREMAEKLSNLQTPRKRADPPPGKYHDDLRVAVSW